jgi:diaminopimelate epimerase
LPFEVSPERVRLLCDRHEGVGSDGLLLVDRTLRLRILNPDGSEAEKSGNGIRIAARWLVETGRVPRASFTIETLGGPVSVEVDRKTVTANMGQPSFRDDLHDLEVDGERLPVVALSMGNPHCVVVRPRLDRSDLLRLGPLIERHTAFPNRTNVQLARPMGRERVGALIWERGAGETRASGSSACAVVAACHRLDLLDRSAVVEMPGGELDIRIDDNGDVWMRGPVEEVARIDLSPDLIARMQALP